MQAGGRVIVDVLNHRHRRGLVEREGIDNGETRKSLTLPDEWFTRLADAVYRGAFETMSARVIAEPLPASAAE